MMELLEIKNHYLFYVSVQFTEKDSIVHNPVFKCGD